jgi:hypothetical protein
VVAFVPTPAGMHGVNWGAKLGGGYYAYVTNQHANVLTIIDADPNGMTTGLTPPWSGPYYWLTEAEAQGRPMVPGARE